MLDTRRFNIKPHVSSIKQTSRIKRQTSCFTPHVSSVKHHDQGSLVPNPTSPLRAGKNASIDRVLKLFNHFACATRDTREGVIGDMDGHFGLSGNTPIQTKKL